MPIIDDPQTLAAIVNSVGGVPVEGRTFMFRLPLGQVRDAIPRIVAATGGLGCRRIEGNDFVEQTPRGPETFVTVELFRKQEESKSPGSLMDLLPW